MDIKKFFKASFFCLIQKKPIQVLILICVMFPLLLFLPSCGMSSSSSATKIDVQESNENLTGSQSSDASDSKDFKNTENSSDNDISDESKDSEEETSTTTTLQQTQTTTKEGLTIRVYYADAEGIYIVGEERLIKGSHKYLEAFIELMKPPIAPGLLKLIPDTAKVNKITKDSTNIDIDLSQSFVDDRFKSSSVDMLLIYSIVNTMTEFPEINTVTFHFDGKKADTFGQMDLSGPFYRDASLIKQNS